MSKIWVTILLMLTMAAGCTASQESGIPENAENSGFIDDSEPLRCANGEPFTREGKLTPSDRGTVGKGSTSIIADEVFESRDRPMDSVGFDTRFIEPGDVVGISASSDDQITTTVTLVDLEACEILAIADPSSISLEQESWIAYELREGQSLGIIVDWEGESFEALDATVGLSVKSEGSFSKRFCRFPEQDLALGELAQGELDSESDQINGPRGQVFDNYEVDLVEGQVVQPEVSGLEGAVAFIYNSDCVRVHPVPRYLTSVDGALEVPKDDRYRLIVTSNEPVEGSYEAGIVEP